jgi:N-acetyl-gamma-glutamyl-phosphate reductase
MVMNMKYKAFIDGRHGTTGLKIEERLAAHPSVEMLSIPEEKRKDASARKALLNAADVVFLCLPDTAARESVALCENPKTRIIDASTAHRTDPAWAYGLPELSAAHREKIARARLVSVPGCYATCFALAVYPLIESGIIGRDYPLAVSGVSGYSGAGRAAIEKYENSGRDGYLEASLYYSLALQHKHVPEMQLATGLEYAPAFNPIICDFRQGMAVAVPIAARIMKKRLTLAQVHAFYSDVYYGQRFVRVMPHEPGAGLNDGFLDPMACNETNYADLFVLGNEEQLLLMARLDNLGKGSSGAAVQCMNIMLGLEEGIGI